MFETPIEKYLLHLLNLVSHSLSLICSMGQARENCDRNEVSLRLVFTYTQSGQSITGSKNFVLFVFGKHNLLI